MSIDKNELKQGFWKALDSDRTVMLGTTRVHARPMTGLIENGNGPVWFFTADDNAIVQSFKRGREVGRYRQAYVYCCPRCGSIVEPYWMPAAAAIDRMPWL